MVVTCPDCRRTYNDTNRWTICPHRPLDQSPRDPQPKETAMIKPTVGRVVHFYPATSGVDYAHAVGEPQAAIIAKVWSDTCVNLAAFDANGSAVGHTSVRLVQDGEARPDGYYCAWMPFQVGQAAKTEELQKAVGAWATEAASLASSAGTPPAFTIGVDPARPGTDTTSAAPAIEGQGETA